MIVLIWPPAKLQHVVTYLSNYIVAPHNCLLIVARLGRSIISVGNSSSVGIQKEKFRLNPSFYTKAFGPCIFDQIYQNVSRCLCNRFLFHDAVSSNPGHFTFPRKLDNRVRIRNSEHVGMCRCHIKPSSKSSKAGAFNLHVSNSLSWH